MHCDGQRFTTSDLIGNVVNKGKWHLAFVKDVNWTYKLVGN